MTLIIIENNLFQLLLLESYQKQALERKATRTTIKNSKNNNDKKNKNNKQQRKQGSSSNTVSYLAAQFDSINICDDIPVQSNF